MQRIQTPKAELRLIRENLVRININDNIHLEPEDVELIHIEKLKLVEEKSHAVLLLAGKFTTISKEARELSAANEITENRIAKAIVVNSLAQRIVGNFFVRVNKPKGKTRIFNSEENATKWLERFL